MSHQDLKTILAEPPSNEESQHVTFGFTDDRGRAVGYLITTSEIDLVPAPHDHKPRAWNEKFPFGDHTFYYPPGHYYFLACNYTVNQRPYGVAPTLKMFSSASVRRFAIDRAVAAAKDRAFNKTREGRRLMDERRQERRSSAPKLSTKDADKRARREAKEAEAAAQIRSVEAEVQVYLDNPKLMDYLNAHPWPLVIPGPPSMNYTAFTHIVEKPMNSIKYVRTYRDQDRPKAAELGYLKTMLRLLNEQTKRLAQGLSPDSMTDRKLLGYR
jgi:hypothetical protein